MATPTAMSSPQQLRIVSRRAQRLLQKQQAAERQKQGITDTSASASNDSKSTKEDTTPWPKPIRYTFYTACAAAVPFSIGSAIAMSPRLREWLALTEEDIAAASSSSSAEEGVMSSKNLLHLVRQYWGHPDYVPPIDQPSLVYVSPGYRNEWEEDNWSSFLNLFGLYTPPSTSSSTTISAKDGVATDDAVPMSLEHEPPASKRHEQAILSRYLSPQCNPTGMKARLSLIPAGEVDQNDYREEDWFLTKSGMNDETDGSYYNLPTDISTEQLRKFSDLSNDSSADAKQLLEDVLGKEKASGLKWNHSVIAGNGNGPFRWVVDFADTDESELSAIGGENETSLGTGEKFSDAADLVGEEVSSAASAAAASPTDASKMLRHRTSIHSAWTYFPEFATSTPQKSAPARSISTSIRAPTSVASSANSTNATKGASPSSPSVSDNAQNKWRIQQLEYQIETLKKEMSDPACLRDRDAMEEELNAAKKELRSLRPGWWGRIWGR